jgi:predicted enzyme related to lactoylglutathione lyase
MANPFVHIELTTSDLKKSKDFYGQLFDWQLEDMPMGPNDIYTLIKVGEGTGGGMFQMKDAPPIWLSYVLVDDIKAATQKARSLGATIIRENHEVPGMGWLSIFTDPQGAMLALWQAKQKA